MRKGFRVALVTALVTATLVYTLWGSQYESEDLVVRINFWSLVSIPFILGFGIWWIRRAGP
jgi:hypothetical protein